MVSLKVYNQVGEEIREEGFSDDVFNIKANESLIHQVLITEMANKRVVLADTKDKSEVRGGGKKPWKQKGTGRARVGSRRSPIWIGGGITFGPTTDRNFSKKINQKMTRKAILGVIGDKVRNNNLIILDNLELKEAKTKELDNVLKNLETKVLKKSKKRKILFFNNQKEEIKRAGRNLEGVKILNLNNINIVDLLNYNQIILTLDIAKKIEENYKKVKN